MILTQLQENLKIINLTWQEKFTKIPNIYTFNTVFQPYKSLIPGNSFNLATASKNTILNVSKNTAASKTTALDNISCRFLRDGAKVLAKSNTDLCNLSIPSRKFPKSCKIAKLMQLLKKRSLTKPPHYSLMSLLPLILKVIEKNIHNQANAFLNF